MQEFDLKKYLNNNPLFKNTDDVTKITKSKLKKMIIESLIEAKKDKEEDLDSEDLDIDLDNIENDESTDDLDLGLDNLDDSSSDKLDSKLQEINDLLLDLQQKALDLAKENNDTKDPKYSKFQTQISNTIKYFTSDFIADKNNV